MKDRRGSAAVDWEPLPWPADGVDPFDPTPASTCWLASRSSALSRAFPAGDWRDWGSPREFEKAIPTGYSVLMGLERLAVCLDGVVAGQWPQTSASPSDFGTAPRDFDVAFLEKRGEDWYVGREPFERYDAALSRAIERSRTGAKRTLVLRTLRLTNWH